MDNVERDKRIITVLVIFTIIFTFFGASLAYWNWQTNESERTNIVFTLTQDFSCAVDGGGDITQTDAFIAPTSCTNSEHAIMRELTVTPSILSNTLDSIYMDLWIEVNSIDSGLSNSQNFMYALTTSNTSCTTDVVTKGTFNGTSNGTQIPILGKNFSNSTPETYYLWIWLDNAETSSDTMAQSFSLTLGGECTDSGVPNLTGEAYAIYSEDDWSLTFVRSETAITAGSTYNGKTVTAVYAGFEDATYTTASQVPWFYEIQSASEVIFEDVILPVSTAYWFSDCYLCSEINNLSKLNTSQVTNMSGMFQYYNQYDSSVVLDLSSFDTKNVTDMNSMFSNFANEATTISLNLSGWDTSNVTNMSYMFSYAASVADYTLDLSDWNVASVTSYSNFNRSVEDKVIAPQFGDEYAIYSETDNSLTFIRSESAPTVGGTYDDKTVTAVYAGFEDTSYTAASQVPWYSYSNSITSVAFDGSISPVNTAYWFNEFKNCNVINNVSKLYTSNVTDMNHMFSGFGYNASSVNLDLSSFDTSSVTNMNSMFSNVAQEYYDGALSLNLSGWDTSRVTDMSYMFALAGYYSSSVNINLDGWDTSNVTNMNSMFSSTGEVVCGTWVVNGLNDFDTSSVTNMNSMFFYAGNCDSGVSVDFSGWDTSRVTDMGNMFTNAWQNNSGWDISTINSWNVSNVENMYSMLAFTRHNSNGLLDLSGWNTSKVKNMTGMFQYLDGDYSMDLSGWDVSNVTGYSDFNDNVEDKITPPNFG